MFYATIAELPYFEQYEIISKQKLIEELEQENSSNNSENQILDIVNNANKANNLNIQNAKMNPNDEKKGCKC